MWLDNATDIQLFMVLFGAFTCLLIFIFTCIVRYQSDIRKKALQNIEFTTFLLLFADYFSYIYLGDISEKGFWIIRISNFLLYFLIYVELFEFNIYLRTFISEDYKGVKRGIIINVLTCIGMLSIIVSQFTGIIYYFDANNLYQRGPIFICSYVIPFCLYGIILSIVIQYRIKFPQFIFYSLILFVTLPFICAIAQVFCYGLSLFNLAIGLCAIVMFAFSLIDQNLLLKKIACSDKMTGLPNSHGFMVEVDNKRNRKVLRDYNALYFDVSRMGLINRKYGAEVGDAAIISYAQLIRKSICEDEVLGRLGGSYFVALIRKENTEAFLNLMKGIDVSVKAPGGRGDVTVTMSSVTGIYEIENNDIAPNKILNNIALAVNIAKNVRHKPYIYLTKELKKEMTELRALQELIPRCMASREFKPYYQPKVNVNDYSLCGAEALARWEHDGELITPYSFVPVMEQNDSICDFDFYMLEYVCSDIRGWLDNGIEPPVISVNFSRRNLGNPILAEEIYNVTKKYNVPANLVQIEITETADEYPLSYLKGVVEALKRYGLTTAIDDFGTGSSSIKLIKEVPFDVLKIDKSFIDSTAEKDLKILGHIISMANEVGASVITEGVENIDQVEVLKAHDCYEIQGYFFDKPLPKAEFEKRMYNPGYSEYKL